MAGVGVESLIPAIGGQISNMNAMGMGALQTIAGGLAMRKLEKNRPKRFTDHNIIYNQRLAQNIASQGLPQQSLNYYTNNINKSLGAGINAILSGGGDLNMIQSLVGGASNQFNQVMAQDAEQKLANQGVLMQQNQNVANENQMNWNFNTAQPSIDKYNRAAQMTNSGMTNFQNGLIGSAGTANAASTGQNFGGKTESPYSSSAGQIGQGGYGLNNYGSQYQMNFPQNNFNKYSPNFNTNWSLGG